MPSVFACMANESMPWHNQVKEEKCLDNDMVRQPYLYPSVLTLHPSYQ